MKSKADPSQVAGLSRFFKTGPGQYGEGDKFLGIKVPVTREVVKRCWREVGFPELEECMASEYHEVRLAALLALVEIFRHAKRWPVKPGMTQKAPGITREQCVEFYLNHTSGINNWDLVDLSCYPLLGEWLLDKDRSLLYELARNGKTLWEQRIGMVSTMTFIRHGEIQDTFAIADILLYHPHDLIHKAVGWLLREAGKKDKPALEAYLQGMPDHVGRDAGARPASAPGRAMVISAPNAPVPDAPRYLSMPRTALRYAIEKFPEAERRRYLNGQHSL
ncbi:MAG: DNA alkylation repair protein [Bacteroidales bacterium]|nr:DNA alkylation repair protein [Bacteroidales bacterium]